MTDLGLNPKDFVATGEFRQVRKGEFFVMNGNLLSHPGAGVMQDVNGIFRGDFRHIVVPRSQSTDLSVSIIEPKFEVLGQTLTQEEAFELLDNLRVALEG